MPKHKLSKSQVEHVALLGKLKLSPEEISLYTKQIQDIVGYVDQLARVDTSKVKPTYQTLDGTANVFREDKIQDSLSQEQALSQAKETYQGYFVAPGVFGKKTDSHKLKPKRIKQRKKIDQYNAVLTLANPKGQIGHKDLFLTKGIETTAGSQILHGYIPQYSATVVKKLEKKGFKTKYKLNQDAWGHGSSGENSAFGPTTNPWDKARTPGGSSSGSATAVATGMVDVATGTDTCGSIRLPANYTNTVGLKPTYGAISRYGVIAFASSLDCPSLLARTVTEVKKYFQMIAAPDALDATSQSTARHSFKHKSAKTIGLPEEFLGEGVDPEVVKTIESAAKVFEKKGYKIRPVSIPHTKYGVASYYLIAPTETASNLGRYTGVRYGNDRQSFGAEAKRRIMLGSFASSAGYAEKYYEQAAKIRTLLIKDFATAFRLADIILAPIAPTPPFLLGEKIDDPLQMYLTDVHAAPVSLSGLPALAMPGGFTKAGLPIGMQLIGPRWSEDMLFDVGEKYQELTDWHKRSPKSTNGK